MTLPLTEIAQQRTVRLVAAKYYDPPVLRAIAGDEAEAGEFDILQSLTSRARRQRQPIDDYDAWGGEIIRATFAHVRPGGNRFNDETRGAWYAAFDDRTALHEVAFHKTRELANLNHFHDRSQHRAVHASFIGRFHDLRGNPEREEVLHPDPDVAYPHGQHLARELAAQSSRGLIYPSVRHSGGICLVAFQPNAVQDVHPGPNWELRWHGSPEWTASPI